MKKSTWSVAAYLLLVFVSGVVVGVFGHRLYSTETVIATPERPRPEDFRKRFVSEHERRLNLTSDQMEKLNAILDITDARFKELRERSRPEMRQIQQEQVEKIQAILSPDQQREYAKLREERERLRQKHRESRPSPR